MAKSGFDGGVMSAPSDPLSGQSDPDPGLEERVMRRKFHRNVKPAGEVEAKPEVAVAPAPVPQAPPEPPAEESAPRPKRFHKSKPPGLETLIAGPAQAPGLETVWEQQAAARRPLPWGWFVVVGLVIAGGICWAVQYVAKAKPQLEAIRRDAVVAQDSEERSVREARDLIQGIERAARTFAAAADMESMLAVSRHPERVRPLMEDHYARHPIQPMGGITIHSMKPLTLGSRGEFWMVSIELEGGSEADLIVEAPEDADAKVDWETAVCYQPLDWDDFVETRPQGRLTDFRVYLEPDNHFSHEFDDEKVWDCYRLTSQGSDLHVFGYVKKDSPTAEMIRKWFQHYPQGRTPMILCLTIPEGANSPNGVVIDHAKSVRWIYVVPPYAE